MRDENDCGIRVRAPAKLNLVLDILRRRPDGYHDLRSLMTPITLFDDLVIARAADGIETCVRPVGLPGGAAAAAIASPENLATRAAALFFERAGWRGGCRISVLKRIPVGAGLGGGSADGAAVLLGLNALLERPFPRGDLAAMGADLGCDVPPLVWGGPVRVFGRGDRVAPLGVPVGGRRRPFWLVLLNAGFPVATGDIYQRWNRGLTFSDEKYKRTECVFAAEDVDGLADCLWNGLQPAAFAKYPALALLADALREAGARGVLLAGSGGTVFGLAASRADAQAIRRRAIRELGTGVWSRVVRTMPDGVMVAHGPLEARV